MDQLFQTGMQAVKTFQVQEKDSATHLGSGSLRVLATPGMVAFIEQVARTFIDEHLPAGYTSVGVHVDVRHLAATPVGSELQVKCEVIEVSGSKINFQVLVCDEVENVGEGTHQRVVIDVERFMRRVKEKAQQSSDR
jgi:fluoroacetyl-CoA thioesterase